MTKRMASRSRFLRWQVGVKDFRVLSWTCVLRKLCTKTHFLATYLFIFRWAQRDSHRCRMTYPDTNLRQGMFFLFFGRDPALFYLKEVEVRKWVGVEYCPKRDVSNHSETFVRRTTTTYSCWRNRLHTIFEIKRQGEKALFVAKSRRLLVLATNLVAQSSTPEPGRSGPLNTLYV